MVLGRKKLEAILPSQNNALRHLNRLKFRLCHIAALSFVPLASPYKAYAIALLPASSVWLISKAALTNVAPSTLILGNGCGDYILTGHDGRDPALAFGTASPSARFVDFRGTVMCSSGKFGNPYDRDGRSYWSYVYSSSNRRLRTPRASTLTISRPENHPGT
jgi:hypothetical protein